VFNNSMTKIYKIICGNQIDYVSLLYETPNYIPFCFNDNICQGTEKLQ
jgi:hypothetical protein